MDMYAKLGLLDSMQKVFELIPVKDVISWNNLIIGYAQNGLASEAIEVYKMTEECKEIIPNQGTWVSILPAYAHVGDLQQGNENSEVGSIVQLNCSLGGMNCYLEISTGAFHLIFQLQRTSHPHHCSFPICSPPLMSLLHHIHHFPLPLLPFILHLFDFGFPAYRKSHVQGLPLTFSYPFSPSITMFH